MKRILHVKITIPAAPRRYSGAAWLLAVLALLLPQLTKADKGSTSLAALQRQVELAKTPQEKADRLIETGKFYLLKPGEDQEDMDNARKYAQAAMEINRQLRSDRLAGDILFLMSQIEKESGRKEVGLQKLKEAIAVYRNARLTANEGLALMELRHYYDWAGPGMNERLRIVQEAIARFAAAKDTVNEAAAYVELGDLYQLQENATDAIISLRKAITLYQAIGHKNLQSVYNLIGHIYTATGDLKNGLNYGHLAVKTATELKDSSMVAATTYNRLAVTYSKLDRLETALELLQKALMFSIKNQWDDGTVQILGNIIDLSIKRGAKMNAQIAFLEKFLVKNYNKITPFVRYTIEEDLRMFFIKSKNIPKAKYYLDKCMQYEREGNLAFNTHLYYDAVEFYLLTGNVRLAKAYLAKMEKLKDAANDPFISQQYYLVSYKTDSASGEFRKAFASHARYKTYSDSIQERKSKYELKVMAARYDLENKDAEIALKSENITLLQKDIASRNEIVIRSNRLRNITIFAMVILVLLLLSLYSRSRIIEKYSTSIAKKNGYLQDLLKEKEWLIREVHHRVKNNLQMIISLIDSQASYLSNDALHAVMDSKHRIEAMSLIHQKLYLTDNTSSINMRIYIKELVTYLKDSLGFNRNISFTTDVDEIELDVSHATPVGLILNEAITNALKYAFPGTLAGKIDVSFKYCDERKVSLTIQDSGVGLPPDFDPDTVSSLGMSLMYGLATEVSGTLRITGEAGTRVLLTFSLPDVFLSRSPGDELVLSNE